jgi:hypothetical protein
MPAMNETKLYPNWKDMIVYGSEGPEPQILTADEKVRIILAGLEPGQRILDHAEAQKE